MEESNTEKAWSKIPELLRISFRLRVAHDIPFHASPAFCFAIISGVLLQPVLNKMLCAINGESDFDLWLDSFSSSFCF